jgi:oxygen-dependent protoporphyrinogen oxidase
LSPDPAVDLVVVGGGVAGLAAAWEAVQLDASVTVLEAAERTGGKLVTSDLHVDGSVLRIDEGADAFLARVPDAVGLCRELGLDGEFVTPATGRAHVWFDGALRPLPDHHVLGVPLDADDAEATGLLSAAAVERLRTEPEHPGARPIGDVSVGDHLGGRLGREVVDHLVGPLVGGISAGDVDRLSLEAVTPQLADAARSSSSERPSTRTHPSSTGSGEGALGSWRCCPNDWSQRAPGWRPRSTSARCRSARTGDRPSGPTAGRSAATESCSPHPQPSPLACWTG